MQTCREREIYICICGTIYRSIYIYNSFSRMRSEVFSFTLGTCVRSTLLLRSAAWPGILWPCLWGVLQMWSLLEKRRVTSFRVAGVAHFVTFKHVS